MSEWIPMKKVAAKDYAKLYQDRFNETGFAFTDFNPTLNPFFKLMREKLWEIYNGIDTKKKKGYDFDFEFGIKLYKYFHDELKMSEVEAANPDYWRYIQVAVVPDLICDRWPFEEGKINSKRLYSDTQRLYFNSEWWFIHILWAGDEKTTRKYKAPLDISHVVDRSGKNGIRINLMKEILHQFANIPESKRINSDSKRSKLIDRVIMLNATYCTDIEPELMNITLSEYVHNLYVELGVIDQ